jgi:hypothetical protein
MWALVVSIIFFLLAFIAPQVLSLPNKLWFKFGLLIGSIVAPNYYGVYLFCHSTTYWSYYASLR